MKNGINKKRIIFYNSWMVVSIVCFFALASCDKESTTIADQQNIFKDFKTEMRVTNWCDGYPMPIPPVIASSPLPYIVDDTCCCFTLQFSPVYTLNATWQIIGVDNDSTYAKYNVGCHELTGDFDSYQVSTCINTRATHITVTLIYPGITYCTMLELPCK